MSLLLQSSPACGATTASGTAQGRPVLSQCGPAHGCKAGPVWSDHHNLARRQRMYGHQLGRCWLPIRQPAASLLRCSAPTSPPRSLVRHSSSIGPVSAECAIAPDQVPQRQVGMDRLRPMCRIRHTSFYRCTLFKAIAHCWPNMRVQLSVQCLDRLPGPLAGHSRMLTGCHHLGAVAHLNSALASFSWGCQPPCLPAAAANNRLVRIPHSTWPMRSNAMANW